MAGCLPLSQWLSTPARSLMSDPTRSQSRRIRSLAAANTLAATCAGVTWRSGRDRAVQYAVHSCVMTRLVRVPHIQTCYRTPVAKRVWNFASSGGRAPCQVESSYRTSCHGEAASLVIGCAVDPTLFCGLLYLSFELLIGLASMGM